MKIDLKGIHKVTIRHKGKPARVYLYAWRGGPRLMSPPGSLDLITEYQAAIEGRPAEEDPHRGTFQALITAYQKSPAFLDLAPSTRSDYTRRIRTIETAFGDLPIAAIDDDRIRGEFLDWRDQIAQRHKRAGDYTFAVLARICAWAADRRKIRANPCTRPGKLWHGSRRDVIWQEAQISALLARCSASVALPFLLALGTGQRQGDILKLTWAAYDGERLRLVQSKTDKRLTVPLVPELRRLLDAERARRAQSDRPALTICTTSRGAPWTSDGYRSSFRTAQRGAQVQGVTFHDTRGTAVLELARAGCTVPEIASITGHKLSDCAAILEAHYLGADRILAEQAIAKINKRHSLEE